RYHSHRRSNPSLGQAIIPTEQHNISPLCETKVPIPHSGKRSFRHFFQLAQIRRRAVPIPHSGKRSFRQKAPPQEPKTYWGSNPSLGQAIIPTRGRCWVRLVPARFQSLTRASDHSDLPFNPFDCKWVMFQSLTRASDHSDSFAQVVDDFAVKVPIPHSGKRSFRPPVQPI